MMLGEIDAIRKEVEQASGTYYYSTQQSGIDRRTKQLIVDRCRPFFRPPHALDLGFVDGQWTDALLEAGCLEVDIVEGAALHADRARERYAGHGGVRVFHRLFEEFEPAKRYDTIVLGDVLRHLHRPEELLVRAREWLGPGGTLIATVPNRGSFHRRIGALLGLEASPGELSAAERALGNQRTFDRDGFRALLEGSGLRVPVLKGCFLKPLASRQIEGWDDRLLQAFLAIGDELEDYCWFFYAVCGRR